MPTPKNMRLLGNALMVIGATIAGSTYETIPWVAATSFIIGLVGKFLTEYFVEG